MESHDAEDLACLRRCLEGAPGAWEGFAGRFRPYLAEVCRRWLRHCGQPAGSQEVDDLVQEVFLALLQEDLATLRRYGGRAPFRSFLAALASHKVMKLSAPPRVRPLDPEFLVAPEAPTETGIGTALESLPPRQRLAVTFQMEGISLRDIGRALGISEDAAAQLLARARATLKAKLKES